MLAETFVPISSLCPNTTHANVVGVIIAKTDARGFPNRRNFGSERFTFGFAIKDSPDHFINVSSWGSEEYIYGLCSHFRIGDCVIIENPLVVSKDPEKDDRFSPSTPTLYRLLVTETHSKIRMCSDLDTESRLLPLLHVPGKDPRDFYSLGDIVANGQSLDANTINILAAVQSVGEPKYFTTSDGRKGQRLEVKLFDETVTSFPLVSWDKEAIQLVQTFTPGETVLFIADARVSFDTFRNTMAATVTSKTVITVNPDTAEANLLFNHARELSESGGLDEQERQGENIPVESISDVLTVSQVKAKIQENFDVAYGITYGFITTLGLDSSVPKVIRSRCSKCKSLISEEIQACANAACPGQGQPLDVTTGFDLLVDISDHTGTLQSCSLSGTVAEMTLGCTVEEFMSLSESQRTAMKWKFLLERCKVYLKVFSAPRSRNGVRVSILSCALADPVEVKQSMSALAI
ncbi:meiosis-specific with OB domain-containing protein [Chanos chanos]|uniref:Meiosis-specific with OB domain-containing protein n=1 Tax=Chanos chanos TaxID=29144 RepID=A0A6J2VFM6_CHACN|nr:meiosis-specific with OB domain-containing protein [Chanos chanos]